MPADFIVRLGDFAFQNFEVPENILGGTAQTLVVHQFPGGKRVVDAMGRDYPPISWSGRFRGADALSRLRALEAICNAGLPVTFSWSEYSYLVMVRDVARDFRRKYEILYTITLEVIEDQASTLPPSAGPSLDEMIDGDALSANSVSALINDSGLNDAIAAVQSAVDGVNSFVTATTAQINAVLVPIATAQDKVSTLIESVGATVENVATLGGVLPSSPVTANVAALTGQVTAMTNLTNLYGLGSLLGRMSKNLGSKQQAGKQVTLAGGNLYQIASEEYGDPTVWTGIAKANDLTDPQVQGVQTITVPPASDGADGVWTP
ncbi:MAG: hypothetical protein GC190_21930 [Alphaproteobacteria bacterium]|nr:hypothetical protein [Alphaproteobacteria bacterium]